MKDNFCQLAQKEPYRIFFPLGIIYLLIGSLLWLPQIWNPGEYPVLLHRFLMLNGFVASFIAGFLMTAVPKFSKTVPARKFEVVVFLGLTLVGCLFALVDWEVATFVISSLQALWILFFLFFRIFKRQANPPYSFVFIFVGLFLWVFSALASAFIDNEVFKQLHYEGAIAAIILGVGSRLIPGILGHVEIVSFQRKAYEVQRSVLSTVPVHFILIMLTFVGSYFLSENWGASIRALDVAIISLFYWRLYKLPKLKSAMTWCLWSAGLMILASFILKAVWTEGGIHSAHAFFLTGVVLLSLLIATRVVQSHGPGDQRLENKKILYLVTALIFISAATRVSAYVMEEHYLTHLGYSSLMLVLGVLVWSFSYLKLVNVQRKSN